jgi:hypothetical protein
MEIGIGKSYSDLNLMAVVRRVKVGHVGCELEALKPYP